MPSWKSDFQTPLKRRRVDHETPIHKDIGAFLRSVLPPITARTLLHIPNGENRDRKTGAKLKAMGVKPGAADWLFVHRGSPCFIEVKVEGNKLRKIERTYQRRDQKQFEEDMVAAGAFYAVCRSIQDVRELLDHWNISTREI